MSVIVTPTPIIARPPAPPTSANQRGDWTSQAAPAAVLLINIVVGTAGLAAGAMLFAVFAVRQRQADSPLAKPSLLANKRA